MIILHGRDKKCLLKFQGGKKNGDGSVLIFGEEGVDVCHLAASTKIFIGAG